MCKCNSHLRAYALFAVVTNLKIKYSKQACRVVSLWNFFTWFKFFCVWEQTKKKEFSPKMCVLMSILWVRWNDLFNLSTDSGISAGSHMSQLSDGHESLHIQNIRELGRWLTDLLFPWDHEYSGHASTCESHLRQSRNFHSDDDLAWLESNLFFHTWTFSRYFNCHS